MTIKRIKKELEKLNAIILRDEPNRLFALCHGFDVQYIGGGFVTIKETKKRNEYDAGSDYNPGGYIFIRKIKDLSYYLLQQYNKKNKMKKYLLKFISPSFVNMEIAHVYKKENIAVATDSYKLLEIKLDDYFENVLPDGYYTREEWKMLSDEKKKDQWERIILTPRPDLRAFPDYNQIMPKDTEVEAYKGKLAFSFDQLKDFLSARNESEKIAGRPYKKELCFDPGVLLESAKGMLYHKNENSRILLMPINIDKR